MEGHTDTYLDYVKSVAMRFKNEPTVMIEKHVDLDRVFLRIFRKKADGRNRRLHPDRWRRASHHRL